MSFKLFLILALAGSAAAFIIQNATAVELTFLFWTLSMSRALMMFLIWSAGVILGWMLHGSFTNKKTQNLEKVRL